MKRYLILIARIAVVIALALYLLPLIYKKDIENKAKKEINSITRAQVNFNSVSVSFFKDFPNITISLHNLNVIGENEFYGDTLINVKEADAELGTWDLIWGKKTELKSVHLKDAFFDVLVLKDGAANYDIFIKDSTDHNDADSSSVHLALDEIKITNGTIKYVDKSSNTYILMEGFDHVGKGDFEKDIYDYSTETKIPKTTFHLDDLKYLTNKEVQLNMVMEMNLKENKYSFKENLIRINDFQIGLQGFIKLLANGTEMDLTFITKETEFKNILSLIPGVYMKDFKKIKTKGEITFGGFVKGKLLDDSTDLIPKFHVAMKIKDAMFKVDTLPNPLENIQMDLEVDNKYGVIDSTIFDLKKFHVSMGKHPIDGRIKLEGITNCKMDADIIANMELAELEAYYPIHGMDLKGKVDFILNAKGQYITGKNAPQQIPAFHLDMKLANGKIKYDSLPAAFEDIQLHLIADNKNGELKNTIIDFKSIHMDMGGNPIHGYARIEGYKNYLIDADIVANLDLADVAKIYPVQNISMKGLFDLNVKAKGAYDDSKKIFPAIDAKMKLTNGYLLSSDYPEPMENIHLVSEAINKTGNFADTKLTIDKLTYTLEGEPFDIKGTVSDLENYIYDLKIKGRINLEKITKLYPIEDYKLSGVIDTDIETSGRLSDIEAGRYDKTTTEGTVEIKDMKISGEQIPPNLKIKNAQLSFTPTKIILKKLDGRIGKGNIHLKGDLYNYMSFLVPNSDMIKGDLNLVCDTLDMNFLMAKKRIVKKTNDTIHTITLWEVPRNIDFVFDSYINICKYEDMLMKRIKGEIKIKDGILSLNETGFNSLNAKFKVSGDYNTQNIKHPVFDLDVNIQEFDMHKAYTEVKLIRDMAPAIADTYGIFSVNYKVKGELNKKMDLKTETLIGAGEIRIADAKINGMKIFEEISKTAKKQQINNPHIMDLVINTEIKDNQLFVKPFAMNINGFNAEVEGVNDINGTIKYIVRLELLSMEKLKIPFHVTGTYDNPKVAIGKGHKLPE